MTPAASDESQPTASAGTERSTLRVYGSVEQLADGAAALIAERLSLLSQPQVSIALSGGTTPAPVYRRLAQNPYLRTLPWSRLHWFWCDERLVAQDHPDSNFRLARETLLGIAPVPRENLHPVPVDLETPDAAAQKYQEELQRYYGATVLDPTRPLFDLVILGMGDDGHTASLLPGQPALEERERWAAAVVEGRPEARVTLTYPVLESSRVVMFLVTGANKHATLLRVRSGDRRLPAARLNPQGECIWLTDRRAAGG